jgi:hypothetical protein
MAGNVANTAGARFDALTRSLMTLGWLYKLDELLFAAHQCRIQLLRSRVVAGREKYPSVT